MKTKPKSTEISADDRLRHAHAVDSIMQSLLALAEIELKRYDDIAATAAMRTVSSGAGSLGFNVTFRGDRVALIGGFLNADGTMATQLLALTINRIVPPGHGAVVH